MDAMSYDRYDRHIYDALVRLGALLSRSAAEEPGMPRNPMGVGYWYGRPGDGPHGWMVHYGNEIGCNVSDYGLSQQAGYDCLTHARRGRG